MLVYPRTFNTDNAVAYIFADGKLQAFKPLTLGYSEKTGFLLVSLIGGKKTTEAYEKLPYAYASEEDYRINKPIRMTDLFTDSPVNVLYEKEEDDADEDTTWYYMSDAGAESITNSKVAHFFNYEYGDHTIGDDDVMYYWSKPLMMNFEDIKVIDENGNERVHKSLMSKLALTDKQREVWNNFVASIKALRENNISVICDDDDNMMYAVGGDDYTVTWKDRDPDEKSQHYARLPVNIIMKHFAQASQYVLNNWCCLNDAEDVSFYRREPTEENK